MTACSMRPHRWPTWLCLLALCTLALASRPRPHSLKRRNPTYAPLSDQSLDALAVLSDRDEALDFDDPTSLLAKILVPRVSGTKNLTRVQELVEGHFSHLGWANEFDAKTPLGSKPMKNLVFTHDPSAPRRFVLAAHLDSKYFPTHPADQFVGATDSAAPCAMLLDLATALTPWLDERKKRVEELGGEEGREGQGETLQIVFFDGEEAFVDWTAEDSIYGAKHLAEKWSVTDTSPAPIQSTPKSPLRRISHFVLLDLLGAPNPLMRSFFPNTGWLFDEFLHSEERLGQAGLLWPGFEGNAYTERKGKIGVPERSFFVPRNAAGMQMHAGSIEDDHLPFMKAGVPIVHLIAVPFPSVWHTIRDAATALDLPTIKAWALILRLTVAEYLGLDPSIPPANANKKRKRDRSELVWPSLSASTQLFDGC
ncbi:hypothetical protein BMF94_0240 [Rhodotorula taiwanensis]|uniref:Peptide hydrolase n=1 Tax=Rhodotorula taiwanensis TaxID=741276 RepID=A0A2S5BIP5_9BASI|nr:hypothetical protein BMF94_0240 [Rhodotorula taiwanensis]